MRVRYELIRKHGSRATKKIKEKTCRNLDELQDWIALQIRNAYSCPSENDAYPVFGKSITWKKEGPESIALQLSSKEGIFIHLIASDQGVIFSDGEYTGGKRFCNAFVKEWLNGIGNHLELLCFNVRFTGF